MKKNTQINLIIGLVMLLVSIILGVVVYSSIINERTAETINSRGSSSSSNYASDAEESSNNHNDNNNTTESQASSTSAKPTTNTQQDAMVAYADARYFNDNNARKTESEMDDSEEYEMLDIEDGPDVFTASPVDNPGDLPIIEYDDDIKTTSISELSAIPDHIKIGNTKDHTDMVFLKDNKPVGKVSFEKKYSIDNLHGFVLDATNPNYMCVSDHFALNLSLLQQSQIKFENIACSGDNLLKLSDEVRVYEFNDPEFLGLEIAK